MFLLSELSGCAAKLATRTMVCIETLVFNDSARGTGNPNPDLALARGGDDLTNLTAEAAFPAQTIFGIC